MRELEKIVREAIVIKGMDSEHKYQRMFQIGTRALKELHYDTTGVPTIVRIPIDADTLTATLPVDYLNLVDVGITDANGNFRSMQEKDTLALPRSTDDCGGDTILNQASDGVSGQNNSIFADGIFFNSSSEGLSDHFRNGEVVGRFYGIGGGNNAFGYYRVDDQNHRIQFSSTVGYTSVVLEYLSNPTMQGGKAMVHEFAEQAVIDYIMWQLDLNNDRVPMNKTESRRRDYFLSKGLAERRFESFNLSEAFALQRKSFQLAPKI